MGSNIISPISTGKMSPSGGVISTHNWPHLATLARTCNSRNLLSHKNNLLPVDTIKVELLGSWDDWEQPVTCQRHSNGSWSCVVPLPPGVYHTRSTTSGTA